VKDSRCLPKRSDAARFNQRCRLLLEVRARHGAEGYGAETGAECRARTNAACGKRGTGSAAQRSGHAVSCGLQNASAAQAARVRGMVRARSGDASDAGSVVSSMVIVICALNGRRRSLRQPPRYQFPAVVCGGHSDAPPEGVAGYAEEGEMLMPAQPRRRYAYGGAPERCCRRKYGAGILQVFRHYGSSSSGW